MSNDIPKIPNQKDYKDLTPFDLVLIQKFPFIEEDFDAINIYGIISKIKDYLNTTIANEQIVTENQQKVFKGFTDLHNYVEDYFTNLNVQEEINNKLDDMVEDGTLSQILGEYINTNVPKIYKTYADMIDDTSIIEGNKIILLSTNHLNDGLNKYYIVSSEIETEEYIELNNGLYANLINNIDNNYYNFEFKQERLYDTDCYIVTIPKIDEDNNIIMPYISHYSNLTPNQVAQKEHTSTTINATLGIKIGDEYRPGCVISNGEIIRDVTLTDLPNSYKYICIDENRNVWEENVNGTSPQALLNQGAKVAWNVFFNLIKQGQLTDLSQIELNEGDSVIIESHPRMALGVKNDGTIIILACDGRTENNKGLTAYELQTLLISRGCYNAWNLDGGGSTSLNINEVKVNRNIDGDGTIDRLIGYTLNFKKETTNIGVNNTNSSISKNLQRLNKQIRDDFNNYFLSKKSTYFQSIDFDEIKGDIFIGLNNNSSNYPVNVQNQKAFYIFNIPHFSSTSRQDYNAQIAIQRDINKVFSRVQVNGVWKKWTPLNGMDIINATINPNQTVDTNGEYKKVELTTTGAYNLSNAYEFDYTNNDIIINSTGYHKIKCEAQFNTNVAGAKYLQIQKNGAYVYTLANSGNNVNDKVLITIEAIVTITNDDIANGTNKVNLAFSGQATDKLERGKIFVEHL